MSTVELSGLQTEAQNPETRNIDQASALEICQIINREDATVSKAVRECLPVIATAIESLVERVCQGGRIISMGAGTSGRLGVLDASELPPTFSVNPEKFVALIAGGDNALRNAQEGAEDDVDAAVSELKRLELDGERDTVIGIAASGRTPYVLSGLAYAKSIGCNTIGIACSYPSAMSKCGHIDHMINAISGPEVVAGSTRLKAGTATKLILNMLSTATMIKSGKTYGNIMVDLRATNLKLQQRARNILQIICERAIQMSDAELDNLLKECDGSVKLAVTKLKLGVSIDEARQRLSAVNGVLSKIDGSMESVIPNRQEAISRPEYVLCVDGGGSKCAAVIHDSNGGSWRGEGGSCNVMGDGIENAMLAMTSAIETAVVKCSQLKARRICDVQFARIWIALAGYDRETVSKPVDRAVEQLFGRSIGHDFMVSTDVELLANVAGSQGKADSVVVVIAGTGSIAMRFVRQADKFIRTGRAGGWGPLLGDDGSGFDIGRRALRQTLAEIDQWSAGRVDGCLDTTSLLSKQIIRRFVPDARTKCIPDLLSAILPSGSSRCQSEQDLKRRIASLAPLVIEASSDDTRAESILQGAISNLVQLMQSFMQDHEAMTPKPLLVFAGGLMKSPLFRERLQRSVSGTHFMSTIIIQDPAHQGAEYLAGQQNWRVPKTMVACQ